MTLYCAVPPFKLLSDSLYLLVFNEKQTSSGQGSAAQLLRKYRGTQESGSEPTRKVNIARQPGGHMVHNPLQTLNFPAPNVMN